MEEISGFKQFENIYRKALNQAEDVDSFKQGFMFALGFASGLIDGTKQEQTEILKRVAIWVSGDKTVWNTIQGL